jgi:hypothetical protein
MQLTNVTLASLRNAIYHHFFLTALIATVMYAHFFGMKFYRIRHAALIILITTYSQRRGMTSRVLMTLCISATTFVNE